MVEESSIKSRMVDQILKNGPDISRQDLAKNLKLSMPTVLNKTRELMDAGLVLEGDFFESTGGRKARKLRMNPQCRLAAGIDITLEDVRFVLVNVEGQVLKEQKTTLTFRPEPDYYQHLEEMLGSFLKKAGVLPEDIHANRSDFDDDSIAERENIFLGTGISMPGIISSAPAELSHSHALGLSHYSLAIFHEFLSGNLYFINDASAAHASEIAWSRTDQPMVYLSISNTVGGSFYNGQTLVSGDHYRACEFGHTILYPQGKTCYCGKQGCADSYLSCKVLIEAAGSLKSFFERLDAKEPGIMKIWQEYSKNLALLVSNIRMIFDCPIMIGGYLGPWLPAHSEEFKAQLMKYNGFDQDTSYILPAVRSENGAATGAAMQVFDDWMKKL